MELSFEQQSIAFLWSIPLGAAMGVLYGTLKLLRFAFRLKKRCVIAIDIIFMLLCSLSVFYFSLGFLDGYVRIYVILGAIIGFFVYRLTLGRMMDKILKPVIGFMRKIIAAIFKKIKLITKKLLKIILNILYNIFVRLDIFTSSKTKRKKYGRKSKRKRSVGSD